MEVALAGGSILARRELPRADVAQITCWTAEQRRRHTMKRDYRRLLSLQPDPEQSHPLEYYDQLISNRFEKFLADYPASKFEADVRSRLELWRQERDRVAGGQVKFRGQWLPAAEAARRQQIEQATAALEQAWQAIRQGRYESAARQLDAVLNLGHATQQVAEARALLAELYPRWLRNCGSRRPSWTGGLCRP